MFLSAILTRQVSHIALPHLFHQSNSKRNNARQQKSKEVTVQTAPTQTTSPA